MKAHLRRPFGPQLLCMAFLFVCAKPLLADDTGKGVWLDRPTGGKLNLFVEAQQFELHFYDADGNAAAPDAAQGIMHCTSRVVQSRETLALLPSEKEDKTILASPRLIRPPYQYDILLVLNFDDEEEKPESHHIVFIQESPEEDAAP